MMKKCKLASMQEFLFDKDNLSALVRSSSEVVQRARQKLANQSVMESAASVSSLLGLLASSADTSEAQDLRDGAFVLLEQVNLRRLPKDWLADTYAHNVSQLKFGGDPDGNIDALLNAGEIIVPSLATQDVLGVKVFNAWNTVAEQFQEEDDGVKKRVQDLAIYSGVNSKTGEALTFEDAIKNMAGRRQLSISRFWQELGYPDKSYFTHIISAQDSKPVPKHEDFYRHFQRVPDIDPREILGLLRIPEVPPWLLFIEDLQANVDNLPEMEEPTFGKALKRIRERIDLTRPALAEKISFDKSILVRYELGHRPPSPHLDFYERLLKVDGVSPKDILTLLQYPNAPWYGFIKELRCGL